MTLKTPLLAFVLLVLGTSVLWGGGQDAQLATSMARIGDSLDVIWGSPNSSFVPTVLVVSDGPGPSVIPGLGTVGLDLDSPAAAIVFDGITGPDGMVFLSIPVPSIPSLVTAAPIWASALVVDLAQPEPFALSKTVAVYFENPGHGVRGQDTMLTPRREHGATALNEGPTSERLEVFISGGAQVSATQVGFPSGTSELFDPLTRTFRVGPSLLATRIKHQSVLLDDGRVLLIGGFNDAGIATASCEIYDPDTDTMSFAAPMSVARGHHCATRLQDGRVLVTGGCTADLLGTMGLVHSSAAMYDPMTDSWAPVATPGQEMRADHAQVLLPSGDVLITGGAQSRTVFDPGANPPTTFHQTTTFDAFFDFSTETISTAGFFNSEQRYGHTMSLLGDGTPVQCGGFVPALISLSPPIFVDGPATGFLKLTMPLRQDLLSNFVSDGHAQVADPATGDVLILGARNLNNGDALSIHVRSDGVSAPMLLDGLGTNPGLNNPAAFGVEGATATALYDGSIVLIGGRTPSGPNVESFIFLPN